MSDLTILYGDARHIPLADHSVQCVVTSPPYWGLRKYAGEQELVWGGREDCEHQWATERVTAKSNWESFVKDNGTTMKSAASIRASSIFDRGSCINCGAWRGAYGLELTVEMYVQHTVEILREIRRVLRSDGVCFWNIGDSYARDAAKGQHKPGDAGKQNYIIERGGGRSASEGHLRSESRGSGDGRVGRADRAPIRVASDGLKPKDLCLIPQRVALAAQADGWWVRSDIIWAKPNAMPESVRDRPTDSYEHILMLTKSARYYWDADAVSQPATETSVKRLSQSNLRNQRGSQRVPGKTNGPMKAVYGGRNKHAGYGVRVASGREDDGAYLQNGVNVRNVWMFATQPYKGAHFATFPEELPRRCILAATKQGDLVLDPFAGSGTVGRVAIELNRRAVLIDIAYQDQQGYAPLAQQRTRGVQRTLSALFHTPI